MECPGKSHIPLRALNFPFSGSKYSSNTMGGCTIIGDFGKGNETVLSGIAVRKMGHPGNSARGNGWCDPFSGHYITPF